MCEDNRIEAIQNANLKENIERDEEVTRSLFLEVVAGILKHKEEDERRRKREDREAAIVRGRAEGRRRRGRGRERATAGQELGIGGDPENSNTKR